MKGLKRKSPGEKILYCVISALFMIIALSYLYILVWTAISSMKTHSEIVMNPFSLPKEWQFKNYLQMIDLFEVNGNGFFSMVFNSIWFSVAGCILTQAVTVTLAYVCSKYIFPGSKIISTIVLIVITLPIYGNGGAMYSLCYRLGLVDSYAFIITGMTAFNMWFLYYTAYFKNISFTYIEAALMDGADDIQIYTRVMLPQAKPIITACFLTTWLGNWNGYADALVYLPNLPTLPVGIYQFNIEMVYRARLDILFAACVVASIPALVLFIAFNKVLTESVSVGGIKG